VRRCAYAAGVDDRQFVEDLMDALPEAFAAPEEREHYLGDEPLAYPALGDARIWIEDHALTVSRLLRLHAQVKAERADAFARFWDFVESQALASRARDDAQLQTLLAIECFEGVGWVEDVIEYLGPETRALLLEARHWLAGYNDQVGRWASPRLRRRSRR
jgi:hypothetical protein